MKKIVPALLVVLFCFIPVCSAGQLENAEQPAASSSFPEETGISLENQAEQQVKMLPSRHGNTIDSYLTKMAKIPMARDLGWKVAAIEDGYEVIRSILINNTKTLEYIWHVSKSGESTPANDKAKTLMQ